MLAGGPYAPREVLEDASRRGTGTKSQEDATFLVTGGATGKGKTSQSSVPTTLPTWLFAISRHASPTFNLDSKRANFKIRPTSHMFLPASCNRCATK